MQPTFDLHKKVRGTNKRMKMQIYLHFSEREDLRPKPKVRPKSTVVEKRLIFVFNITFFVTYWHLMSCARDIKFPTSLSYPIRHSLITQ